MPDHLSNEEKEEAYDIFMSTNENLNRFIDSTLDEISAMGAGSVAGRAGGFGPPNRFNVYQPNQKPKNRKTMNRKSTTKRAKRQRRR